MFHNTFSVHLLRLCCLTIGMGTALAAEPSAGKSPFFDGNPKAARKLPLFKGVDPTAPHTAPWQWWDEARLGIFMCYGMESHEVGKDKLSPEENFKRFNPDKFDAGFLVREAKKIGGRYIVFTANWHDDFCLWNTKLSEWRSTNTPGKRDLCAEMYAACQAEKMPLIFYQGIRERRSGSPVTLDRAEFRMASVRELMTAFPQVAGFWFDYWPKDQKPREIFLHEWYEKEFKRPDIFIGRAGQANTPEGPIGPFDRTTRWETCDMFYANWFWYKPMNIGNKQDALKRYVQPLIHCAGNDGNMLRNWAINPSGTLDHCLLEVNELIGEWMRRYGHSIHGTRGGPFHVNTARGTGGWCAPKVPADQLQDQVPGRLRVTSTCKGNTVWLHILDCGGVPSFELPPIPAKVVKSEALTGGAATVTQTDGGIGVGMETTVRHPIDTIIAVELDRDAFALDPVFGLAKQR